MDNGTRCIPRATGLDGDGPVLITDIVLTDIFIADMVITDVAV
jgi:hypothetical protein